MKLKPEQLQAVRYVYDGKDVFVVAYRIGKSVCYKTLPLCVRPQRMEAVLTIVLLTVL